MDLKVRARPLEAGTPAAPGSFSPRHRGPARGAFNGRSLVTPGLSGRSPFRVLMCILLLCVSMCVFFGVRAVERCDCGLGSMLQDSRLGDD